MLSGILIKKIKESFSSTKWLHKLHVDSVFIGPNKNFIPK